MHNKYQIIEEPCEIKVSCTVLKTNGAGDSLVEFNDDRQYKGLLSFLDGCPLVFCCGGVPLKLRNNVRIWLSRFSDRVGGIFGGT